MKDEPTQPLDLQQLSFDYALHAIKLYQFVQQTKDDTGQIIGKEYLQAAIAIGCHLRETQKTLECQEKYQVAQKEARKSIFLLQLLAGAKLVPQNRISALIMETKDLLAAMAAIDSEDEPIHPTN